MRGRSKSCTGKPREQARHAVRKIKRAVSMKIVVKERKRLVTVSQRRGVDKTKNF